MIKVKLGDVAIEYKQAYQGNRENVPNVGLEHLISGEVKLSCWDTDNDNTFTKRFNQGQVLLGRRRAYLKKAVVAPFDGICSGDITVIEAIPNKILPELLPFIIQNNKFFDYAVKGSAGSLSPRVKWEYLKEYEFDLPPIEEQERLAELLWAAYDLKESYKKLIAATDEMVKLQFIEITKDSSQHNKVQLKDLIKESFSGEWGDEDKNNYGVKVIRTTNFTNSGILDLSNLITRHIDLKKIEKKKLQKEDILLERSGGTKDNPVGRVVFFDVEGLYLCNNFTQVLRCNQNVRSRYVFFALYINYQLNKDKIRSMGNQTTGIQNLKMDQYMNIGIAIPSIEIQTRFVETLKLADKSKQELQQSIEHIDKVMKSLLP